MQHQIDDASYAEGRAAFTSGASLRSIVEQVIAAGDDEPDMKTLSGALGFFDALLDFLRGAR